jgi:hypothetical protein
LFAGLTDGKLPALMAMLSFVFVLAKVRETRGLELEAMK